MAWNDRAGVRFNKVSLDWVFVGCLWSWMLAGFVNVSCLGIPNIQGIVSVRFRLCGAPYEASTAGLRSIHCWIHWVMANFTGLCIFVGTYGARFFWHCCGGIACKVPMVFWLGFPCVWCRQSSVFRASHSVLGAFWPICSLAVLRWHFVLANKQLEYQVSHLLSVSCISFAIWGVPPTFVKCIQNSLRLQLLTCVTAVW